MIPSGARAERRRWWLEASAAGFACLLGLSAAQRILLEGLAEAGARAQVLAIVATCALAAALLAWGVTAAVAARWRRILVGLAHYGAHGRAAIERGRFSDLALLDEALASAARRQQAILRHQRAKDALRRRRLAEIVHDVATPVSSAQALVEAGRARAPTLCASLQSLMAHVADAVRDLGSLSRVERPRLTLTRERTDVGALVRALCAPYANLATVRDRRAPVEIRAAEAFASVDPSRVRSAVVHLLDNALRHGDGGPVRVEARATSSGARVTVTNRVRHDPPTPVGSRLRAPRLEETHGLGVPWVRAVAAAHGATFTLRTTDGWVQAELTFG